MSTRSVVVAAVLLLAGCATPAPQVPDAGELGTAERERYVSAFEALRGADPAGALELLEPLVAHEPWHVPSHVLRQDALAALGRSEEAGEWYAAESVRVDGDPRRVLLSARLGPGGANAREAAYRRALELDPDLPWSSVALTYELLRKAGDATAAATSLRDRGYRDEAAEAATVAEDARREAVAFARRGVEARPDLAAAHAALAEALLAEALLAEWSLTGGEGEDRVPEALASAVRAADLDPGNPARHALLARALRRALDDAGAAAALERAIDLSPRDAVLLGNAGRIYIDLDRASDAVDVLERAVEESPADGLLQMNLGVARQRAGDLEGARAALRRACELAGDDPRPFEALGLVLAELGDRDGAALAMNRYLELGGPARSSARRFIDGLAP